VNLFPVRRVSRAHGHGQVRDMSDVGDMIRQPFLSYDNYSLVKGEMLDYFYTNLEVVRRLSWKRVPLLERVLSNAHFNYMENTDANVSPAGLRHHGPRRRGIQYFSYFTGPTETTGSARSIQFGNKTRSWDMIRYVNNRFTRSHHAQEASQHRRLPFRMSRGMPAAQREQAGSSVEIDPAYGGPARAARFRRRVRGRCGASLHHAGEQGPQHSFRYNIDSRSPATPSRLAVFRRGGGFGREMDWIAPGRGTCFASIAGRHRNVECRMSNVDFE